MQLAPSWNGRLRAMIAEFFKNCALYEHPVRGDVRGSLVAIEALHDVPFEIKRLYYMFGTTPGANRGFHAHHDLHQWAICVNGSCSMVVDNGRERHTVSLDRPEIALHIGPMVWREMSNFAPDTVLMVLASAPYDEADYIRLYPTFLELANRTTKSQ